MGKNKDNTSFSYVNISEVMNMWKRVLLIGCILIFLSGCSIQTNEREKLEDLEYTIIEDGKAPEDLQTILEEKRKGEFKLTYEEEGQLYLCIGYGE